MARNGRLPLSSLSRIPPLPGRAPAFPQRESARTRLTDAGHVLPGVAGIGMSGSGGGPWPADFNATAVKGVWWRSTHWTP
ncbi:hypothetical protein TPA0598_03_04360 [Streptomyces lydicamycinicus]|uniref:Uncharacterized protein n=1 Tax=Streptomyces lydicamycinicus TaxID=1546107 RepID=A0A0P4R633_9ACTN|nr:hypothetical protein TPA0598_03_04360 [Streptomyces lydicamycinicus]